MCVLGIHESMLHLMHGLMAPDDHPGTPEGSALQASYSLAEVCAWTSHTPFSSVFLS